MRWLLSILFVPAFAQNSALPTDWQGWLNQGVRAYRSGRYVEAEEAFQKAVDLNPFEVAPRLYLATTWMTRWVPGSQSPDDREFVSRAVAGFMDVLQMEPNNKTALSSLASLNYSEADGTPDLDQKLRKLDEAASWYEKVLAVDPQEKNAHYSLGVIAWKKWYPNWMRAREQFGMKPDDSGPLPNASGRRELIERYGSLIEQGISNLERALQIDPMDDVAMAYLNLLIRERADLRDSLEEYRRDIALGDQWVQRAMDTKRAKARAEVAVPQRIRVGAGVQQLNLIRKVEPVYPPLAKQARIQGTVRLTATIDKDGRVRDLELISGHPLLVESAREAVMRWEYRPTLLSGEPVEVITQVDVNFTLGLNVQQ